MYTDKHCGTENNYPNIKDHNNEFSTSNDMLFLFTPFSINQIVFQLHCSFLSCHFISKMEVWGELCIFFCIWFYLIKLSNQVVMALNGHHVIHRQKLEAIWKM